MRLPLVFPSPLNMQLISHRLCASPPTPATKVWSPCYNTDPVFFNFPSAFPPTNIFFLTREAVGRTCISWNCCTLTRHCCITLFAFAARLLLYASQRRPPPAPRKLCKLVTTNSQQLQPAHLCVKQRPDAATPAFKLIYISLLLLL